MGSYLDEGSYHMSDLHKRVLPALLLPQQVHSHQLHNLVMVWACEGGGVGM